LGYKSPIKLGTILATLGISWYCMPYPNSPTIGKVPAEWRQIHGTQVRCYANQNRLGKSNGPCQSHATKKPIWGMSVNIVFAISSLAICRVGEGREKLMRDAYIKALRQGLNTLHTSGTIEFIDYLRQTRSSFLTGLEQRVPPLDDAGIQRETAEFEAAIDFVVKEFTDAQHEQMRAEALSSSESAPAQNNSSASPEAQPEPSPAPDFSEAKKRLAEQRRDHPIASRMASYIMLALMIVIPATAMASPLFTSVMAWGETVNIFIATGAIAVLVLLCTAFSPSRFVFAVFFGLFFFATSLSFHKVSPLRNFAESEPYILAMIADTVSESYFALAELTGIAPLPPGEPRLSVAQRRDAFEKEVDAWLNK